MPELHDGESVEVWGSGSKPYQLKNVAGVYSCSCPAWRNQSLAIDRRTCKHIRNYRGEEAEAARLGTGPTRTSRIVTKSAVVAPQLLLAETWNEEIDPAGWWLSELCGRPHNSLYVVTLIMWRTASFLSFSVNILRRSTHNRGVLTRHGGIPSIRFPPARVYGF